MLSVVLVVPHYLSGEVEEILLPLLMQMEPEDRLSRVAVPHILDTCASSFNCALCVVLGVLQHFC